MGKAVEKRYYNKEDTMYLSMSGNNFLGLFDLEGNCISLVTDKFLDMGKLVLNNETYVVRAFRRKGICLLFKLKENDIKLNDSIVFALHGTKINYVNLWEGLDL